MEIGCCAQVLGREQMISYLGGHRGKSLFRPLFKASPESHDVPVSLVMQCPRHPGACRLIRSGAVENNLFLPGQQARKHFEVSGRYPPGARQNPSGFQVVAVIAKIQNDRDIVRCDLLLQGLRIDSRNRVVPAQVVTIGDSEDDIKSEHEYHQYQQRVLHLGQVGKYVSAEKKTQAHTGADPYEASDGIKKNIAQWAHSHDSRKRGDQRINAGNKFRKKNQDNGAVVEQGLGSIPARIGIESKTADEVQGPYSDSSPQPEPELVSRQSSG
jgi:hypothetical protein